jgi:CRP/FNR family cyclic AMP-dependent transcriptional regulator
MGGPRSKATKRAKKKRSFDPQAFLTTVGLARSISHYRPGDKIFSRGDPSDAVLYIQKGRVKLTIISKQGKEAIIAILGAGDFLGEACLTGQMLRVASATAIALSSILRVAKHEMVRVLQEERALSGLFSRPPKSPPTRFCLFAVATFFFPHFLLLSGRRNSAAIG